MNKVLNPNKVRLFLVKYKHNALLLNGEKTSADVFSLLN